MKKVLIIEDDAAVAALEQDFLRVNGFEAVIAANGATGLQEALKGGYDLILLDLILEDVDGFEVCRQIRKNSDIPVLMVSAKGDDVNKIRGFDSGADDFITKPFSPTELVARVIANIVQYERIMNTAVR